MGCLPRNNSVVLLTCQNLRCWSRRSSRPAQVLRVQGGTLSRIFCFSALPSPVSEKFSISMVLGQRIIGSCTAAKPGTASCDNCNCSDRKVSRSSSTGPKHRHRGDLLPELPWHQGLEAGPALRRAERFQMGNQALLSGKYEKQLNKLNKKICSKGVFSSKTQKALTARTPKLNSSLSRILALLIAVFFTTATTLQKGLHKTLFSGTVAAEGLLVVGALY